MKIAVSYLKSPFSKEETIKKIEQTSADYLHVDLMDGKFVPSKNFEINQVFELLKSHQKPLDIHLMTEDLENYIDSLSPLNPEFITFHLEQKEDIFKIINLIKEKKIKVGLAIKPNTPIKNIKPYLKIIDLILIMSVEPGKGGQSFLEDTPNKIKELKKYITSENILISVDGGINEISIKQIKNEVDMVVSGSYICESDDYESQIQKLKTN